MSQTITDGGNFTFRLRQLSKFRSPSFIHTLGYLFLKSMTNLDSLKKHDRRSLLSFNLSFLHHSRRFCHCLAFSKGFTAGSQLFHAALLVPFGQIPPLQSPSAFRPVVWSNKTGCSFPVTVSPIAARISQAFGDSRLGNSKLSCNFHLLNAVGRKRFYYCNLALCQIRCSTCIVNVFYAPNF